MPEGGNIRGHGFSVVVAMDRKRGIGKGGALPWKLSGDMRFFKELTTCPDPKAVEKRWGLASGDAASGDSGKAHRWDEVREMLKFAHPLPEPTEQACNAVLMGRKTWQSLKPDYQPLPRRNNLVLSRNPDYQTFRGRAHGWASLGQALEGVKDVRGDGEIFVIGGGQVYEVALVHPSCAHLYITEIDAVFDCDTFFPETLDFRPVLSSPWIEENGIRYRFRRYDRT